MDENEKELAPLNVELSDEEKKRIRASARKNVEDELKKLAKQKLLAAEEEALRQEYGVGKLQLGGHLDELVTVTVDLSDTDGKTADPFIQLDIPFGTRYYHGRSYTLPRHIANDLNWIMFRGKLSNLQKDGKSVFRGRTYGTQLGEFGVRHTGIRETRV